MLRSVDLSDYMRLNPVTVSPDDSVYDAIHHIIVNKVSGVCVVDEYKNLLGIVSEIDCLRAILSATYNESGVGRVKDFMTTKVVTAAPHEDIVDVAADMLKHSHRRRPVVDNGKLVGQITCRQLLRAVKEFRSPKDKSEHKEPKGD